MHGGRLLTTTALALTVCMGGLALFVRSRPVPADSGYLGSSSCESCHAEIHREWSSSQHTKMMRPANQPGVVVADFDSEDPDRRFGLEDAVWAIGGKWEQQFMGHDGVEETLLPGVWLKQVGRWDFKGFDGWELPVPHLRCHGCHTVGLDPETGEFVEPNIGCESCHGPSEWHESTFGLGRVHSSADAQVCGQCHSRGLEIDGEHFFPAHYRPGLDLDDFFRESRPSLGQNSNDWWGNGRSRKRHQEFIDWRRGGHSGSLRSLREGYDGRYGDVGDECLACHAGDHLLASGAKPGLDEVREGITCSVCHNVHGRLDELRVECNACHLEGAYYHQPERNADHVACPEEAGVGCVGCHMPQSVTGGGAFVLHDHGPGVVPPRDTETWGTPSSCANGGCHALEPTALLQARFEAHYGAARHMGMDAR